MRVRETVKKLEAVKTYGTIKRCGRRRRYRLAFALAAVLGIVSGGTAAAASQPVFCPQAVAAGPDGSLMVTDCYSKVIWKVTGDERTVYAGKPGQKGLYGEPLGGYGDGTRSEMRMEEPWDIVPYGEGYAVSDRENHMVRYIDAQGSRTLTGRGREGYEDNRGGRALFSGPTGLAADDAGNLYIADTGNAAVRKIENGTVATVPWDQERYPGMELVSPSGLVAADGALYVCDRFNRQIYILSP